jgi:hypothetical protein
MIKEVYGEHTYKKIPQMMTCSYVYKSFPNPKKCNIKMKQQLLYSWKAILRQNFQQNLKFPSKKIEKIFFEKINFFENFEFFWQFSKLSNFNSVNGFRIVSSTQINI